ncbi:hypothetical protein K1X84_05195 [bacterium]|nr:hypothetical protein [bacterium]
MANEALAFMPSLTESKSKSFKKEMIRILDQFLRGYISAQELKKSAVPMLMVSANKKGRKNYIEKYLMDIAGKPDAELTRNYIFGIRENIAGEQIVSPKNRKLLLRRSLRKLIERLLFDEIDNEYFLSMLFDLAVDFHDQVNTEPEIKFFIETIHNQTRQSAASASKKIEAVIESISSFYENYYKGLWDD